MTVGSTEAQNRKLLRRRWPRVGRQRPEGRGDWVSQWASLGTRMPRRPWDLSASVLKRMIKCFRCGS